MRKGEVNKKLLTDFVPPEGVPIRFTIAGLGARLVAQMTDILITVAALIGIMSALYFSDVLPPNGLLAVGAILFFAIRAPYYTLSEILMNGQTPGKRLSGLRVISADGRTLSAHAVTVRNLMKEMEVFVPGTLLLAGSNLDGWTTIMLLGWIIILLAVPLTNHKRQRLGDMAAGTYVVNLPTPVLLPDLADDPLPDDSHTFLPHQLDHYGRYELQTLEALLQVDALALTKSAHKTHERNLQKVAATIARRISYHRQVRDEEAAAFLLSFYRTQRAYLENRKLFGEAREDKFHRDTPPD